MKKAEFRSLKKRLIDVRHLLEKYPDLAPEKRTELIQAVLFDNLQRAQQIFSKPDKNNQSSRTDLDVKMTTSGVSDPEFLLQLMGVDDKDLEVTIQEAVNLACGQLSSSIDTVVKKMAKEVLRMQQDERKQYFKHEIDAEKQKELGDVLVKFIQAINRASAGRRTS